MKRLNLKILVFSTLIFVFGSCGMRKSVNHRPDLTNYNAARPKVESHNDSLFSSGVNYLTKNKYQQWELYIQGDPLRSEEHTSELQSRPHLVCRLLLEKK